MRNKKLIILFVILGSVTLLAVLNSIIFSVQHVVAHCETQVERDELDTMLEDGSKTGIKRGRSILLLNEKKVKERIYARSEFALVEHVDIERKFPNRVYINYRRAYPLMVFETDAAALYVSGGLKILSVDEKQADYAGLIRLVAPAPTGGKGELFYADKSTEYAMLLRAASGAETLLGRDKAAGLIESIDMTRSLYGSTSVLMRAGVRIEIVCNDDNYGAMFKKAMEWYEQYKSTADVTRGNVTVYMDKTQNKVMVVYAP